MNFFAKYLIAAVMIFGLTCFTPARLEDPKDKKIEELISKMTLEEKVGQLNFKVAGVVTGPTATPMDTKALEEQVKNGSVGGFFNGYGAEFTRKLQKVAIENSRLKIPLLFGADIVHGFRTVFP